MSSVARNVALPRPARVGRESRTSCEGVGVIGPGPGVFGACGGGRGEKGGSSLNEEVSAILAWVLGDEKSHGEGGCAGEVCLEAGWSAAESGDGVPHTRRPRTLARDGSMWGPAFAKNTLLQGQTPSVLLKSD